MTETSSVVEARLYCVTGMHRSGTSVLARVANILGADIGPDDQLLEALPENPTGFWENSVLKDINDRVLETLGGKWAFPPVPKSDWEQSEGIEVLKSEAIRTLSELASGSDVFIWKDPRNSLTLPFWRSVARIEGTLHAVRSPSAVATSLEKRNQMDRERASALWLRYTASAYMYDPGGLLVDFDSWFEDADDLCKAVAAHVGLDEPSAPRLAKVELFLSERLRHHLPDRSVDAGPIENLATEVYSALIEGRSHEVSVLMNAVASSDRLADPDSVMRAVREESRRGLERLREKSQKAAERGAALRHRVDELKDDLRRVNNERKALKDQLSTAQASTTKVTKALEQEREVRRGLEAELAYYQARVELLTHVNREHERSEYEMDQRLTQVTRAYDRLRNRRVVRMALGVARIARPLFRLRRHGLKGLSLKREKPQPTSSGSRGRPEKAGTKRPDARAASSDPEPQLAGGQRGLSVGLETLGAANTPTIVVPVYGALSELKECITSVVRNTYGDADMLIIDDASPQPEVGEYLCDLVGRYPNVRLEVNDSNLGFVRTVNKAFGMTDGDVVLLNSDTQVPPRWLSRMRLIAHSDPTIGTVTPLSDNAGAFSAPVMGQANKMPLDVDQMGRLVTQESSLLLPSTPTANGFCMYVKREVISATGGFDADSFPRGYGEENDLSMRATAMGWRHVVDDSTFVFHSRSASFREEKADLLAQGKAKMRRLHPDYGDQVKAFIADKAMDEARRAVQRAVESAQTGRRGIPRILYVVHGGGGGTIMTNSDLMRGIAEEYEPLLLSTNGENITLRNGLDNEILRRVKLKDPTRPGDFESASYREIVGDFLASHGVELIHIRHLQRHPFDLPSIAKSLDLPVVLSFHDFYYCCPTVHLLDERDRFCGGTCTSGQGQCRTPRWFVGTPHLKHGWVNVWQRRASEMFKYVDAFVTTSASAVEVYQSVFPQLRDARFEVIEHGRDIGQQPSVAVFPTPGQPARILLLGHVEVHKGAGLVAELQRLDQSGALEFHLLGNLTDEVALDLIDHGIYRREEFARKVAEIGPAVIALLSIWPETYSHTLTEAWSAGIPVVASRLGALGERIDRHGGGGWTVDIADPEGIYEFLMELFADKARWEEEREKARVNGIRTVNEMSTDYLRLYSEMSRVHRTFATET